MQGGAAMSMRHRNGAGGAQGTLADIFSCALYGRKTRKNINDRRGTQVHDDRHLADVGGVPWTRTCVVGKRERRKRQGKTQRGTGRLVCVGMCKWSNRNEKNRATKLTSNFCNTSKNDKPKTHRAGEIVSIACKQRGGWGNERKQGWDARICVHNNSA